MDMDLSAFKASFIEESMELLQSMEDNFIALEPDNLDKNIIHEAFRAAHSIKGGAASFDFQALTVFSHALETVLDGIRNDEIELSLDVVDVLLRAIDALSSLLEAAACDKVLEVDNYIPLQETLLSFSTQQAPQITKQTSCTASVKKEPETEDLEALFDSLVAPRNEALKANKSGIEEKPEEVVINVSQKEVSSIRISIEKIDELVNLIGELVITQSGLGRNFLESGELDSRGLRDGLMHLEHNTRDLQESAMRIRMLPIGHIFNRYPRIVRDLSRKLNKKVRLDILGNDTEIDRTVMEKIGDPIMHLIRNALDHGLESPEERLRMNKPEEGYLRVQALQKSGSILIEIMDDGKGLSHENIIAKAKKNGITDVEEFSEEKLMELLFSPGFSTATSVSDVSGRGVGLDVVKRNIRALGGIIEVSSEAGLGTRFMIRLPLSLAIMDGQLLQAGDQLFVLPLVAIMESMPVNYADVHEISSGQKLYNLRGDFIPMIHLSQLLKLMPHHTKVEKPLMAIIDVGDRKIGLVVDELLSHQQVVCKNIDANYKKIDGVSGATVLGDGRVVLILEVVGLLKLAKEQRIFSEKNDQNGLAA